MNDHDHVWQNPIQICVFCGEHRPFTDLSSIAGNALLTEMHGQLGCDPNCELRYHPVFRDLSPNELVGAFNVLTTDAPRTLVCPICGSASSPHTMTSLSQYGILDHTWQRNT